MINQITLIGRVVDKPTLYKYEDGFCATTLRLAVTRPFKNMEGNYDCDFIRVSLWNGVAQSASEYCDKGDIVGVKGRIVNKENEYTFEIEGREFVRKLSYLEIIGERVVFISSANLKTDEIKVSTSDTEF